MILQSQKLICSSIVLRRFSNQRNIGGGQEKDNGAGGVGRSPQKRDLQTEGDLGGRDLSGQDTGDGPVVAGERELLTSATAAGLPDTERRENYYW